VEAGQIGTELRLFDRTDDFAHGMVSSFPHRRSCRHFLPVADRPFVTTNQLYHKIMGVASAFFMFFSENRRLSVIHLSRLLHGEQNNFLPKKLSPELLFSEGGLGETALLAQKSGFPQKYLFRSPCAPLNFALSSPAFRDKIEHTKHRNAMCAKRGGRRPWNRWKR
ncbi:MAG: hypothetical protein IJQ33_07640, partial [Clostridia bacterium]|nr:hypothetical protein [Clostridia bacterium]